MLNTDSQPLFTAVNRPGFWDCALFIVVNWLSPRTGIRTLASESDLVLESQFKLK
jgi:hypothetical protein